jgi:glycosyltransferase involved in cell wall biosynthesis
VSELKAIILINHYGSSPDTGIGGRTFYMARALHALGHDVTLITASFNHKLRKPKKFSEPYDIDFTNGFRLIRVKVLTYPNSFSKKRIFNWFLFGFQLVRFFRSFIDRADVVLCSSPSLLAFFPSEIIAKKTGAKLIFEVRDIWPLTLLDLGGFSKKHLFIRFLQWVEERAYKKSDIVISNLPAAVEHMVDHGMERDKFRWIPNGFDFNELENALPLDPDIEAQLPINKFVIGYTGAVGEANALRFLIDAAYLLKDEKDIHFVLVGAGREKKVLIERAKNLGNVLFLDPIPKQQIQSMLAKFDVCYLGWKNESIYQFGIAPNKLPEYMVSSTPIIHSYSGRFDVVEMSNSGVSVPAEDVQAIAKAILTLRDMSGEKLHGMGERGATYAAINNDYENLAQQLVATFGLKI